MYHIAEGDASYTGMGVVMLYWEGKLGYCLGGKSETVGEHRLLTDVASRVAMRVLLLDSSWYVCTAVLQFR